MTGSCLSRINIAVIIKGGKYSIGEVSLPKTEAQNERILSLPIYPGLKDDQVDYIISSITEYYG